MPQVTCFCCGTAFEKAASQVRRSLNHFCSRSCAARVNNRLSPKREGTNQCRVCRMVISQRQTFCSTCRTLPLKQRRPDQKFCYLCKETKPVTEFYIKHEESGLRQAFCKVCFNALCVRRWQARKRRAVDYLGGKCQDCGGDFHPNVYDFHHLRDKDFTWNQVRLRTWESIKAELDKCVLLCTNCHRMRHVGDFEEEKADTPPVS